MSDTRVLLPVVTAPNIASIAENGGEMPPVFMRRQGGHLSVAADARSSGRSVSGAFLQAVGVHAPHDRPTRPRPETESHSKIGVSVILLEFTHFLVWLV